MVLSSAMAISDPVESKFHRLIRNICAAKAFTFKWLKTRDTLLPSTDLGRRVTLFPAHNFIWTVKHSHSLTSVSTSIVMSKKNEVSWRRGFVQKVYCKNISEIESWMQLISSDKTCATWPSAKGFYWILRPRMLDDGHHWLRLLGRLNAENQDGFGFSQPVYLLCLSWWLWGLWIWQPLLLKRSKMRNRIQGSHSPIGKAMTLVAVLAGMEFTAIILIPQRTSHMLQRCTHVYLPYLFPWICQEAENLLKQHRFSCLSWTHKFTDPVVISAGR